MTGEQEEKKGLSKIYRKSWPFDNLFGSSRFELSAANRGIWNDLLDMAKLSRVEPGVIASSPGVAYPSGWLATFLNVPLELLEETLEVLKETKRIEVNGKGITIINWHKYQTEYDRQKPYRQYKKANEAPVNLVYKGNGEIDDKETIIQHQSLWKIRQVLAGKMEATKANKDAYRRELKRLGILEK